MVSGQLCCCTELSILCQPVFSECRSEQSRKDRGIILSFLCPIKQLSKNGKQLYSKNGSEKATLTENQKTEKQLKKNEKTM